MFAYDMNHQYNLEPDFVSTMGTQTSFSNNFKIDLLVKQQILKISKTTSDPKRANELINEYMGIQSENLDSLIPIKHLNCHERRN